MWQAAFHLTTQVVERPWDNGQSPLGRTATLPFFGVTSFATIRRAVQPHATALSHLSGSRARSCQSLAAPRKRHYNMARSATRWLAGALLSTLLPIELSKMLTRFFKSQGAPHRTLEEYFRQNIKCILILLVDCAPPLSTDRSGPSRASQRVQLPPSMLEVGDIARRRPTCSWAMLLITRTGKFWSRMNANMVYPSGSDS